ncbi:hypothetical protein [Bacillus sp. AFS088145]|uniref:hypothetical protein n=1 Tax=Bacillus sp. AFS088145 TaxID=2033514 RepID=UPI000BF5614B|nr:hypothetical protein [Bacillus sp. AFS088145]PFH82608.1 hypothetical protein COI44_19905 [Bacillus sp. AFS088145]
MKINGISGLYGLFAFLFFGSLVSYEHTQVLTGFNTEFLWNALIGVKTIILCAMFYIIPMVTRKWLESRLWSLFTSVLWFPYFVLFTILLGILFPNKNLDNDNFAAGLILFFYLFFYPVFILVTTFIGTRLKQKVI